MDNSEQSQWTNRGCNSAFQGRAYNSYEMLRRPCVMNPAAPKTQNVTQNVYNSWQDNSGPKSRYFVDFSSQLVFVGRSDLLSKIKAELIPKKDDKDMKRRVFVTHGLGGSGKTEIAIKFAEDSRDWFWTTLMVDARSPVSLEQSFRDIGVRAGLLSNENTRAKASQVVARWLGGLQRDRDWLLIFDGANDPRFHLEKYLPPGGRGAILITTTSPRLLSISQRSETVSGLDCESAIDLLLTAAFKEVSDDGARVHARRICELLEFLPLPLLQAGSVLRNGGCALHKFSETITIYLRQWLTAGKTINVDARQQWIYGTWVACRSLLQELNTHQSAVALDLLTACCLLDHKHLPFDLFTLMPLGIPKRRGRLHDLFRTLSFVRAEDGSSSDVRWDTDKIRSAVVLLADYSLVTFDTKHSHFSIPRLVHKWLSLDMAINGTKALHSWARYCVGFGLSIDICPDQLSKEPRKRGSKMLRHVTSFLQQDVVPYEISLPEDEKAARKFACLYFDTGHYDLAERWYQRCVDFWEGHKPCDAERHFSALVDVAKTLERKSQFHKARKVCEMALVGWASFDPLSPPASKCRQVLALCLKGIGDTAAAKEELCALSGAQNTAPETNRESTLETLAIHAEILRREGDFAAAVELSEKCYKGRQKYFGPEHPDTLESGRILAITLLKQGSRLEDATQLIEFVLDCRIKVLGDDHPDTILSLGTLTALLRKRGKYAEAVVEQTKVVVGLARVWGLEHPDTLAETNNLANLCRHIRHFQDAEASYRTSYSGYVANENFGPMHPHTLVAKANIAVCLYDQNRLEEASIVYDEVLQGYKEIGKDQHVDALNCMVNQSALLIVRKDFAAAEALAQAAANGYRTTIGEENTKYYSALSMVSRALQKQGCHHAAEKLARLVWEGVTKVCGPEDVEALDALALLAHIVAKQGRPMEACVMYREASNGFRKLGHDDHWCHERLSTLEAQAPKERGRDD